MGKPFKSELALIEHTFQWASTIEIEKFENEINSIIASPLISIGSGGSLSACCYAVVLHQSKGQLAKALTPLELINSNTVVNSSSLLFLSASGRNTDILTSFKKSVSYEPKSLTGLVFTKNSPLSTLASEQLSSQIFEFGNPVGKDGFLATNSLIGFFTLLYRAYGNKIKDETLALKGGFEKTLDKFVKEVEEDFTFQVLYSGLSQPVAIDIESKFSEAALGNVLYSDYRNFGHGRHFWLSKRAKKTCVIALVTPNDKDLAEKTLELFPSDIPVLKLESSFSGHFASIDLLHQSFHLVNKIGEMQNIDPGRPSVPKFGRKLYHLRYATTIKKSENDDCLIAVQRKLGDTSYYSLPDKLQKEWKTACRSYKAKIVSQKYGAVVFDYDGTICDAKNRYTGVNKDMADIINNLVKHDIIVGIATGRGKSIRTDLKKVINVEFQKKVIIGYYNGAEIGLLSDDSIPIKTYEDNTNLTKLNEILKLAYPEVKTDQKRHQLTIEFDKEAPLSQKQELIDFINVKAIPNVMVVESSHSIDAIIKPEVSKLNVVNYCKEIVNEKSKSKLEILCIGDKGRFPGNDFELLSYQYSLSVDEVSKNKHSCWNFSPAGARQIDSTHYYLESIKISKGFFQIEL